MTINRKVFYAYARKSPFGGRLSQQQIDGMEPILQQWETLRPSDDLRWLAYILAGVYHETGARMVPVREGFASTDAGAIKAVTALQARRGKPNYAAPDAKGRSWFGRGRIQNTFADNYRRIQAMYGIPVYDNPNLLLQSGPDAIVTVRGHVDGIWTGKKLRDYFSAVADDPVNARRIVNKLDKASLIATYHAAFLAALTAASTATAATVAEARAIEPPRKDSMPAKRVATVQAAAVNEEGEVEAHAPVVTPVTGDDAPVADGVPLSHSSTIWGIVTTAVGGLASSLIAAVNNPWAMGALAIIAVVIVVGALIAFRGRLKLRYEQGV